MKNVMTSVFLALSLSLSSISQAQNVYIDNQTSCYYILGFPDCGIAECDDPGPMDAPDNDRAAYSFATAGISSLSDINMLCIFEHPSGIDEYPIDIDCTNPISPVYVCQILTCDNNPLLVDWWISGGDFYIELSN